MSKIDHPAHYGGAHNPHEAIKVMEAWLTPAEFVGALKFSFFTYQQRAPRKEGLVDYEKAAWYQNRLIDFIKRTGYSETPPPRLFWTEDDPEPVEDEFDCLIASAMWEPVAVHSNVAPHCRWLVRFPISTGADESDGDEIEAFDTRSDAQAFCDRAQDEIEEEVERKTGILASDPARRHDAPDMVMEGASDFRARQHEDQQRIVPRPLFRDGAVE